MAEQIKCRHGVAFCYRCGVGKNVTEQKFAKMILADQTFDRRSVSSPIARRSNRFDAKPERKGKSKKRRLIPCIHRGEYVGVLDCSCDGERETYRCTKVDRPGHPNEKAFCTAVLTSKRYSRIVDPQTKAILHRVRDGEVILCKSLHTIDTVGRKQTVGCTMYSPNEQLGD